jgi:hypothetical protein
MNEQREPSASSGDGTMRRRNFPLLGMLAVFGLFLFAAQTESNGSDNSWERLRRQRRAQEGTNFTGEGDVAGERAGGIPKIDVDEKTLMAAAAVGIGSAVAALAGGGALLWFDRNVHVIPSRIVYTLPTTISLRELSFTEQSELDDATGRFYSDILKLAYPDGVQEVILESASKAYMTTSQSFIDNIVDSITGKTRNFGYEWKFTLLVKVADAKTLTIGDILVTTEGADMDAYITGYLAPLAASSNIMSNTQTAQFFDRI